MHPLHLHTIPCRHIESVPEGSIKSDSLSAASEGLSAALTLVVSGAETLSRHGAHAEAFDLGDLLLRGVLEAKGAPLAAYCVAAIEAISAGVSPSRGATLVDLKGKAAFLVILCRILYCVF